MLLLVLVFLTGAASATVLLAGSAKSDVCCAQDAKDPVTVPAEECPDAECGCSSCGGVILFQSPRISVPASEYSQPFLTLTQTMPSAPGRSLDYPPELI